MYGLDAISANNGWGISAVGVTIVFSGLVMLSLSISQIHKILALWESSYRIKAIFKQKKLENQSGKASKKKIPKKNDLTKIQKASAKQFFLLAGTMEDRFSLARLRHLAKICGLENPDSNLNHLLQAKVILPDGTGFFTWDKERFDLKEKTGERK